MEYFTQAIVLGSTASREYDRLVSLYTHHLGKITAVARGARRLNSKMAGHLEPFAVVAVKLVSGRDRYTISNVEGVERYQDIVHDLSLMRLARSCLRLVDDIVHEGACDISILDGLRETLAAINHPTMALATKQWLVNIFGLRLVAHLGYRPQVTSCVICQRGISRAKAQFDVLRGGLRCSACTGPATELVLPLSAQSVELLAGVVHSQNSQPGDSAARGEVMAAISALVRSVRGK
ncbi:MAG: DNA repair protein RecO [Patescibacteria group bacterium]